MATHTSLALFIMKATDVGIKHPQTFRKTKLPEGMLYDTGNCPTNIQIVMKL